MMSLIGEKGYRAPSVCIGIAPVHGGETYLLLLLLFNDFGLWIE